MIRSAIYPGTFDPVTNGHLDIIERAHALYDELTVGVAVNLEKRTLFSASERMAFLQKSTAHLSGVKVRRLDGLLVEFANRNGIQVIVRGLRAVSDFEIECQMALMNRKLSVDPLETVFLVAGESSTFLSSRLIKEIAAVGGDVTAFVPEGIVPELKRRFAENAAGDSA